MQKEQQTAAVKRQLSLIQHLIVVSIFVCTFVGCFTLAGAGFGALADAQAPDTVSIPGPRVPMLSQGTSGRLILRDGTSKEVVILRESLEPMDTNREAVLAARPNSTKPIPLPGDPAEAVIGTTLYPRGILCGYEPDGFWFAPNSGREPLYLKWQRLTGLRTSDGALWTGSELADARRRDSIPTRFGVLVHPVFLSALQLLIDESAETEFIRAAAIDRMLVHNDPNNIIWGTIAGFAVDLVLTTLEIRFFQLTAFGFSHP